MYEFVGVIVVWVAIGVFIIRPILRWLAPPE